MARADQPLDFGLGQMLACAQVLVAGRFGVTVVK